MTISLPQMQYHFRQYRVREYQVHVISSTVTIKFSKLKIEEQEDKDTKENRMFLCLFSTLLYSDQNLANNKGSTNWSLHIKYATFFNRLALNVSLNLG
jgi:hypothetical protein